MENYTKIETTDIEQLYYHGGFGKEKKLHAIKKGILVEKDGRTIWQQNIEICDLKGEVVLALQDGHFGPLSYLRFRKSYIICYKNFFAVCAKEIVGFEGMEKSSRFVTDIFTYKGKQLDTIFNLWKKDKEKIKYYNTLAQQYDKGKLR